MPLAALLRRSAALWLLPLTVFVVLRINNEQLVAFPGYAPWAAAQKAYAVVLLGMVAALAGAAEGSWLRRSGLLRRPATRGPLPRLGTPLLLAWAPTAAALVAAVGVVGGLAAWPIWATSVLSLLAWTGVGMALGVALRTAVALPLAVVGAFFWFAFTPSMEPFWLRQLTGAWTGCCDSGHAPSTVAALGVVASSVVLLAAAGAVLVGRVGALAHAGLASAAILVVGGVGIAATMSAAAGQWPVQPRTDEVRCLDGSPRVCLWPEHAPDGGRIATEIRAVTDRWRTIGVVLPATFSEAAVNLPQPGLAPLVYDSSASAGRRLEAFAGGLARKCLPDDSTAVDPFVVQDWLVAHAGPNDPQLIADQAGLDAFRTHSDAEQLNLINAFLALPWKCS
ncbi:MAG: hypothetical protein QM713_01450 [Arachnia sp.]